MLHKKMPEENVFLHVKKHHILVGFCYVTVSELKLDFVKKFVVFWQKNRLMPMLSFAVYTVILWLWHDPYVGEYKVTGGHYKEIFSVSRGTYGCGTSTVAANCRWRWRFGRSSDAREVWQDILTINHLQLHIAALFKLVVSCVTVNKSNHILALLGSVNITRHTACRIIEFRLQKPYFKQLWCLPWHVSVTGILCMYLVSKHENE